MAKKPQEGPVIIEPQGEAFVLQLPSGATIGTAPTRAEARKRAAALNYFWREMNGPQLEVLAIIGRAFLAGGATVGSAGRSFTIQIDSVGIGGKFDEQGQIQLPAGALELIRDAAR